MNLCAKHRLTDNKLSYQRGKGMGDGQTSLGLADSNSLYIYKIDNYSQYPVINHNEKEYEKCVCVYISELLFCIPETQHCR